MREAGSLHGRAACWARAALAFLAVCLIVPEPAVMAASAYSARRSGLEPPGGPRPLENVPGASVGRTPEGGMGYTDAYGNAVRGNDARADAPRRRPPVVREAPPAERPLPDFPADRTPVWNFR